MSMTLIEAILIVLKDDAARAIADREFDLRTKEKE